MNVRLFSSFDFAWIFAFRMEWKLRIFHDMEMWILRSNEMKWPKWQIKEWNACANCRFVCCMCVCVCECGRVFNFFDLFHWNVFPFTSARKMFTKFHSNCLSHIGEFSIQSRQCRSLFMFVIAFDFFFFFFFHFWFRGIVFPCLVF